MLQLATYNKFLLPLLRNSQDWPLDEKDKCRVLSSFFRHKFKTTQEMKEIKLTRGKVALVDDEDYDYLNQWKWHALAHHGGGWYVSRHFRDKDGKKSIRMHRLIMNTPEGMEVDHIDHNGLNNQKSNLRNCTNSQNHMNRFPYKGHTSIYKGVYYKTANKKYVAKIKINQVVIWGGYFKSEIDAAHAYDKLATKYFGEFAVLNFKDDVL
jgi:hypothetical protein